MRFNVQRILNFISSITYFQTKNGTTIIKGAFWSKEVEDSIYIELTEENSEKEVHKLQTYEVISTLLLCGSYEEVDKIFTNYWLLFQ